ncbi:MAG: hypothetical protein AABZ53_10455 [Planctomycetota bacterium]
MAKKAKIQDPPTVADVRKIREKLVRKGGGTIEGFFRLAEETIAKQGIKVTYFKPPRKRRSA